MKLYQVIIKEINCFGQIKEHKSKYFLVESDAQKELNRIYSKRYNYNKRNFIEGTKFQRIIEAVNFDNNTYNLYLEKGFIQF